jgi:primosomal replication protein N
LNRAILDGNIASRDTIRVTPGGVATLNLILNHQSTQWEDGREVKIEVEMKAVVYGDLAKRMDSVKVGDTVTVEGFLSRKNRHSQFPILHITRFEPNQISR